MKNLFKLKTLTIALLLSNFAYAEYQIVVPLDSNAIIMEETPINGSISLSPTSINRGQYSILSWNYDYVDEIDIKGIGKYGKNGSLNVSPLASRSYEIEVIKGTQKKIENLFLTVIQPNQNINFNADKLRIGIGQPVNLSWNVENAEYIDIDNGIGTGLPLSGNIDVYPTIDTTFMLTAKGYEGISDATEYLTIDVVDNSVINSFNASSLNITKGDSVVFNWDVTDSEGLNLQPYGSVSGIPTGSQSITFNNAGSFDYTLESTSLNGTVVSSNPININVYNPSVINTYTINGNSTTIDASPNDPLNFAWDVSDAISYKLNGNVINDTTTSLIASSTTGTTQYTLEAFNGAGDSVSQSLSVNVVGLPVIDSFTGATSVFANAPVTLSWAGTGVSKYEIKSNNAASGIATTAVDLGSALTTNATPTTAGSYTYTLSAYNTANAKVDSNKTVVVEANPTFTGFTVNGGTNINVSPSTALTFAGTGFSTGATLQGRDSGNTANATLPSTAPATAGSYTYYAAATKSLNSVSRYSNVRNVVVNVIDAPVFGATTAPSTVFEDVAFTITYSASNAVNYKIRGNVAASGVATTDTDLGTATSTNITPTAAGSYTYTITATNDVGVTTTTTKTVVVEALPTFTGFTVNGSVSVTVASNTALTFSGSGFSTGATLVGRNSGNTANATLPSTAPATGGTYTYYAAATKTLNSVTKYSSLRSVTVNVENWVAATPTYTSWVNSGGIYGCSNWSPDPSTVNSGVSFTQTATDCEQDQTRTRQNREQETTTLAYRDVGSPITETQTLTNQNNTRSATGTKVVTPDCKYVLNNYYWIQNGTSVSNIKWLGDFSITGYNASLNYYNYNGYKYYKGTQRGTIGFEICKVPL